MKRFISLILCLSLAFGCMVMGYAKDEKYESEDPVILISGFMCTPLFTSFGTDEQTKIWGPDKSAIKEAVLGDLSELGLTTWKLIRGDYKTAGKAIANGINSVMEPLKCKDDGTSEYDVGHYVNDPATSNIEYMLEADEGYLYEVPFCTYLNDITDGKNVFCFQYDSRMDSIKIAESLSEFVDAVLAYTGKEKVKLFTLSYGGLIATTYLYLHGKENKVSRLVMSVPALGGTDLPDRILRGKVEIDAGNLLSFAETALGGSGKFASLFASVETDYLNKLASEICKNIRPTIKNWGSIWCLSSQETYEELKKDFLDEEDNAELIKNIDIVHKKIMPSIKSLFADCRARGTKISIICGTGTSLALGGTLNGDIVLPASGVSGATTKDIGEHFDDDYVCVSKICRNRGHKHVSPTWQIDASTCYLPENTWFVEGHYHGQYNYEEYTRSLVTKLLFTDEIKNIYSSEEYPQFAYSNNEYRTISIGSDDCEPGFVSEETRALEVANITSADILKVVWIKCDAPGVKFKAFTSPFIDGKESIEIPIKNGNFDGEESRIVNFTVYYLKLGSLHPLRKSQFIMTIDG